jgi:ferrous iron transport protein A
MDTKVRLDKLPLREPARIASIDLACLGEKEAKRLAELGFDEGVTIETLHRGPLLDPIACRVGRMTIALRRSQAAAVIVDRP